MIRSQGSLISIGYTLNDNKSMRHTSLKRAVKKYGYKATMAKLNILHIYNRKRSLSLSKKIEKDKKYIRETYAKERAFSP